MATDLLSVDETTSERDAARVPGNLAAMSSNTVLPQAVSSGSVSSTSGAGQGSMAISTEPIIDVRLVAESVVHMANLPLDANILTMTIMATRMPFVGRG